MNYVRIYDDICTRAEKVQNQSSSLQNDVYPRPRPGAWSGSDLVSHLIIPAGIWGSTNTPANTVTITRAQQVIAYALLRKIYPYSKTIADTYRALIKARGKKKRKIPYRRKPHSEATRAKMSAAHKGKTFSAESRKKMSEAKRGVKFTEAHIAARSESRRRNARGFTEESREKMRLAALNRGKRKVSLVSESPSNWSVGK